MYPKGNLEPRPSQSPLPHPIVIQGLILKYKIARITERPQTWLLAPASN